MNKMIRIFVVFLVIALFLLASRRVNKAVQSTPHMNLATRPTIEFSRGVLQARGKVSKEHLHLFHQFVNEEGELGVLSKAIVKRAHDSFHALIKSLIDQDAISTTDAESAVGSMDSIRARIEEALAGGLGLSRRLVLFSPNLQTVKSWATNPEARESANKLLDLVSLLNE